MSFCYMQLHTTNHSASNDFYSKFLGWNLDKSNPNYTEASTDGVIDAGVMPQQRPGAPSSWLPYVAVDNMDKALKKAQDLGATILQPATDVPGKGRYAVIADPGGAAIGLWLVAAP